MYQRPPDILVSVSEKHNGKGIVNVGKVKSARGIDEEDVTPGYVVTGPLGPIHSVANSGHGSRS